MGRTGQAIFASAMLVFMVGLGLRANAADTATTKGPEVRSAAVLVVDAANGEVIFERDAGLRRAHRVDHQAHDRAGRARRPAAAR